MYITLILHMNIIINKYVFASLDFTHMVCDKKYLESIVVWGCGVQSTGHSAVCLGE